MEVKFSPQAQALLEKLKEDVDIEDLKKWWIKNFAVMGSNHILVYLERKKKYGDKL